MYVEDAPTGPIQLPQPAMTAAAPAAARGDYAVITPGHEAHQQPTAAPFFTRPATPAHGQPQSFPAAPHRPGPPTWQPQDATSAHRTPQSAQTLIRASEQALAAQNSAGHTPRAELETTGGKAWLTARVKALGAERLPEIVTQSQPSLAARLEYSRKGAWTASETGTARFWHGVWTRCITIPIVVAAYAVAWAAERPSRALFLLVLTVVLGTALSQLPGVHHLIPDLINVTSWF